MSENSIVVDNVKKYFMLPHEKATTLKGSFLNIVKGKKNKTTERQKALDGVSFEVKKGEFYGIVGRNGSGKSTLLKMLAGIYQPSEGNITVHGRLVPFIELGVGFNGELTGKENVYLNGALLGFSKKEIDDRYEDIVAFAEIERFMDQKLKNYSSGMQVRLAFSLAIQTETDILLVDEVLAVGDANFQRKCFDYFKKLKRDKKTVVFVSHDMNSVKEYCDSAIMIEKGKIVAKGSPEMVAKKYNKMFIEEEISNKQTSGTNRWGDGSIKYTKVESEITKETIKLKMKVVAYKRVINPNFGFTIKSATGQSIMGTNSNIESFRVKKVDINDSLEIVWEFNNIFNDGEYFIEPAVVYENGDVCDWWEDASSFSIRKDQRTPYVVKPDVNLIIEKSKNG